MLRPAWNIYFSIRFCEFCKVTFYDAILEASESKVSADPNSVFILCQYMSATYLTLYPLDKFQYQAVSVQNTAYFHQELGSVLQIHFMCLPMCS